MHVCVFAAKGAIVGVGNAIHGSEYDTVGMRNDSHAETSDSHAEICDIHAKIYDSHAKTCDSLGELHDWHRALALGIRDGEASSVSAHEADHASRVNSRSEGE
jgi:hypothetical protein